MSNLSEAVQSDEKICPHLPAMAREVKNPISGVITVQPVFMPCAGDRCALFTACQGDESPAALYNDALDRIEELAEQGKALLSKLEGLEKIASNPLVSRFFGGKKPSA